jgi:hypothetical protein
MNLKGRNARGGSKTRWEQQAGEAVTHRKGGNKEELNRLRSSSFVN